MTTELDNQLLELRRKIRLRDSMKSIRVQMIEHLMSEKSRLRRLVDILDRERIDVARLERFTVSRLLESLAGTLEGSLRKEREEYFEALMKYEEAAESVVQLELDLERMADELQAFESLDEEYNRLIKDKESRLASEPNRIVPEIHRLAERIAVLRDEIAEAKQTIEAAKSAESAIERITVHLSQAQSAARMDMFVDGPMIGITKNQLLSFARSEVAEAQRFLTVLQDHLASSDRQLTTALRELRLYSFADMFFDSLMTDYFTERRVSAAMSICREMQVAVRRVLLEFESRGEELSQSLHVLIAERNKLIEET